MIRTFGASDGIRLACDIADFAIPWTCPTLRKVLYAMIRKRRAALDRVPLRPPSLGVTRCR